MPRSKKPSPTQLIAAFTELDTALDKIYGTPSKATLYAIDVLHGHVQDEIEYWQDHEPSPYDAKGKGG